MTRLLKHQHCSPATAVLLLLLPAVHSLLATAAHAEVRLHSSIPAVYTVSFRCSPAHASCGLPLPVADSQSSLTPANHSLLQIEDSLDQQIAALAKFSPAQPPAADAHKPAGLRTEYANPARLHLHADDWAFPEAGMALVSGPRLAPAVVAVVLPFPAAEYAATALGGNCTAWDLTSSLSADSTPETTAHNSAGGPDVSVIVIPIPPQQPLRMRPLTASAGAVRTAPASPAAPQAPATAAPELLQPTREGDAVRTWTMPPNIAAKFRGGGFRLVTSSESNADSPSASGVRPARLPARKPRFSGR
ncbi:MAG: hypothetical protein RLZZ436_2863 [Planctomycetota bacterium]|jgi:hypothetical protein